jgi:hypothetical protein
VVELGQPVERRGRYQFQSPFFRQDVPVDVLLELFGGALVAALKLIEQGDSASRKPARQPPPSSWTAPARDDALRAVGSAVAV